MWVSRGIGPAEEEKNEVIHSMGYFFNAGGLSLRTLIDQHLAAGYYQVQWDTRDDRGVLVPQGYYRIYLQAENYFSWRDLAVIRN
jgi:flagellar hook assembly protein FlgD